MEVYASGGVSRQRATTPPNCCSMKGFSTIALMPTARAAASAVGDRYPDTSTPGDQPVSVRPHLLLPGRIALTQRACCCM